MNKLLILFLFGVIAVANGALQSRAIQNFYCEDIVNKQIGLEFAASQFYLSLSNHYAHDRQALHGFSKMFEHHWKEELEHGEKLMNYLTKRGGVAITPELKRPVNDANWETLSVCDVLKNVLQTEKDVTQSLLQVHECGRDNKEDPQLQDFIEGEYLGEQVDGIKEVADLLTRVERLAGSDCKNGIGIHMMDQELLSKYSK